MAQVIRLVEEINALDKDNKGLHELPDELLQLLCDKEIGQAVATQIGSAVDISQLAQDIMIVKTEKRARNTSSMVLVSSTKRVIYYKKGVPFI